MIPKQYKDFNFCRVRYKTKKPFELDWTNKPYSYEEISKFFPKENYGVMTGINELGVLDDDTPDNKLLNLALVSFGETHRVRNHLYYKLKGWDGQKIIFWKNGDSSKKENHLGELQGKGQMVVGAGSIHPSGEVYEIKNNIPIKEIDLEIFLAIFGDYIQKPVDTTTIKQFIDRTKIQYGSGIYEDVSDIPITAVIPINQNVCLQHGAVTPPNLKVYDNYFRCFHCNSWGGVWLAIAVKHGIINCSQAQGKNSLSKSQAQEVVEIAKKYYGLKEATSIIQNFQPMGWACSINIRKMAERFNLLNCPSCNIPFQFKEDLGFYKCSSCKQYGGLKRFALMCYQNKLQELKQ